MILKTDKFKDSCTIIKNAIDNKNVSLYNETLELKANGTELFMNVTNREYYCSVKFNLETAETLAAAVNAKLFLDLISKITSPTIEITVDSTNINVKGNGNYKLPLIFNNDVMLELPVITIGNVTNTMDIPSSVLQSINQFNTKELQRGTPARPVQKYFYVDEKGCITFTSGACVNNFTLPQQIKILLSEKVVKLFKLFKDVSTVSFTLGKDSVNNLIQTKVKFTAGDVSLTAIIGDDNLISAVPVDAIRTMATKNYDYSAVVNKTELLETLERLMLFNTSDKNYGTFSFTNGVISICNYSNDSTETVTTSNNCPSLSKYDALVNMNNLKLILEGCEDEYVTICFGDQKALVIKKQTVNDIIPELKAA